MAASARAIFLSGPKVESSYPTIYENLLKLILKSPSREYFEKEMMKRYALQANLAIEYAKKVFGEDFPPY